MKERSRSFRNQVIILVVIKLSIQIFGLFRYGLHRDEYLYADMGGHLAWGYKEIPFLLPVFAKIGIFLFGHTMTALRVFPLLFGIATLLLVADGTRKMGGNNWAVWLAGLAFIFSPLYLVMNMLFQPNFLDLFFWTLAGYCWVSYINSFNKRWLTVLAIVFGLGMISKYSMAIYIGSLCLGILLTDHRKVLLSRAFLLGAGIGFLFFLPNLIWQWRHGFPLLGHMEELQRTQLQRIPPGEFIAGQLLINLPGLILWITGIIYSFTNAGIWDIWERKKVDGHFRVLGMALLFTIFILFLGSGKNYYSAGAFPMVMALGALCIGNLRFMVWKIAALFSVVLPATVDCLVYPVLPLEKSLVLSRWAAGNAAAREGVRWEDGELHNLPQHFADMLGWEELAPRIQQVFDSLSQEDQAHCIVYGDNYGQTGAVNWYRTKRLPVAVSLSGSYAFWFTPTVDSIRVVIYANEGDLGDVPDIFRDIKIVDSIRNPYARIHGCEILICRDPVPGFYVDVKKRVAAAQKGF